MSKGQVCVAAALVAGSAMAFDFVKDGVSQVTFEGADRPALQLAVKEYNRIVEKTTGAKATAAAPNRIAFAVTPEFGESDTYEIRVESWTDAKTGAAYEMGRDYADFRGIRRPVWDWSAAQDKPTEIPVLSVTKGLLDTDDAKLLTYPQVWEQRLAAKGIKRDIYAIGGPCTSYELVAHDQTEVAFCGKDIEVLRKIRKIMATDYYHISLSTDVVGIESAVALKNGYALGIALTIGLNQKAFGLDSELHFNSQAAVFGQAAKEMKKLLDLQGAGTLENLCVGVGDLYVTVYGGRTRLVGILLGRGLNIDQAREELKGVTLESLVVAVRVARAVRKLCAAGKLDAKDFPLLMHTDEILTEKKPVSIPWEKFTFERG